MFDWVRRMSNAVRTGVTAGIRAYKEEYYAPDEELGFDTYEARLARYWQYWLYANNNTFTAIQKYAQQQKDAKKLYRHIRSIYNPVSRLIDLEVSKVYGGNIDYANQFNAGAIPILGANKRLLKSIEQVMRWSNMGATKNRFVREGGTFGDAALKAVDDHAKGKVRLEILDPRKIVDASFDAVDNVTAIRIEYLRLDELTDEYYLYTETIDKERFATYRDDKPFAFYADSTGELVREWRNEYGFVPVRMVKHKDAIGVKFGTVSFNASLAKIDESNDLASMIHDGIRKNTNPPWAVAGNFTVDESNKPSSPATKRDEQPFLPLPEGAVVTPMMMPLDIPGFITALDKLLGEIEDDMPQLAIQHIRQKGGNPSGVAVRSMYSDASDRIIETQGNYDAAMIAGLQMAISIGAHNRYPGFEGFDLGSYDRGDLAFSIKERPVFPDEVDKQAKLNLILQAADSPAFRLVAQELGYSQEQIAEVENESKDREAAAVRGLATAAFGNQQDDPAQDDAAGANDGEQNQPAPARAVVGQAQAGTATA